MRADRTPWAELLAQAQSRGLDPAQFWRLSLKEWRALTAPAARQQLTRAAFEELARRFPDGSR
jgi:uncharacterized phage protein (TIGR02216 family)